MRGYHPQLVRAEFVETNDKGEFGEQELTLYGHDGETLKKVYRPQPYGLTAHAPVGAHGLLVSFGGERNQSFLIGGEDPDIRPQGLNEKEVKLYDASGNLVYLGMKNGINIATGSGDAIVKTTSGKILLQADGHAFVDPGGNNVYLGLGGAGGSKVMTESGPSSNVYAKV